MALYRLPSDEMVKETILGKLSSITKRRPPLSHMINLFVKDTTTSKAAPFFGQPFGTREDLFRREPGKRQTGIVWSPCGVIALLCLWQVQMRSTNLSDQCYGILRGEFFPALAHSRIINNF